MTLQPTLPCWQDKNKKPPPQDGSFWEGTARGEGPGTRTCFLRQAGQRSGSLARADGVAAMAALCLLGYGQTNGVQARRLRMAVPEIALSGQSWAHSSQPVHREGNSCTATLPSGWGVNWRCLLGANGLADAAAPAFLVKRGRIQP